MANSSLLRCLFTGALPAVLFQADARAEAPPAQVRFATYNASLNRTAAGTLFTDLRNPAGTTTGITQVKRVAEVLQRVRPDVVLINEFDWDGQTDAQGRTVVELFHDNFLAVGQNVSGQGVQQPLSYPYRFTARPNTGFSPSDADDDGIVTAGERAAFTVDFDNAGGSVTATGTDSYANDCFGFGLFPGQYGMVVYSRFPILTDQVRTFRKFLWKDMPGALLPDLSGTPAAGDWYSAAELAVFRLSSKSHWDVPVDLGGGHLVHFLAAHPTPPVFDGSEDRNGRRNHDEIRFWADYIDPARASYHRDDAGRTGGLAAGDRFLIAGDHNADPAKGDSLAAAARLFTLHSLINNTFVPSSAGMGKTSVPTDTADFSQDLRVDYALPSKAGFRIVSAAGTGIFWPGSGNPLTALVSGTSPSDHRAVWIDVRPEPSLPQAVKGLSAAMKGNQLSLAWGSAAGYLYQVEQSALADSPWTAAGIPPAIDPETGGAEVLIPVAPGTRGFFRIVVSFAP